jgi:hypothetical protein
MSGDGPDFLHQVSLWQPSKLPEQVGLDGVAGATGFPWFELACGSENAATVHSLLADFCPGLTEQMLIDLLTPDEEPAGLLYGDGEIRLASSFGVEAWRPDAKLERGAAQGVGVLVFEPVELLARQDWLITCRHPSRTYRGAEPMSEGPADDGGEFFRAVATRWAQRGPGNAGDLGIAVMYELALTYAPAHRALSVWLEDWELSLYVNDELDNRDQLPELWGLMAVLRNWLGPLNKAGLRGDIAKAWLPGTDLKGVVEVDDRVDKALASLAKLSETLRQSFGLLHLEQTEDQRRHSERTQHRFEAAAAVFLVPTLIVGFYGANTWVPGQGRHWGFWVMVGALVLLSICALVAVLLLQRRSHAAARDAAIEQERLRSELLRGG